MNESLNVAPGSRSPRITQLGWGRLEVDGVRMALKDAKLFPGGARAWDWRETGTDHTPGVQPADVEELLEHGATVVVLSRGMLGIRRRRVRCSGEIGWRKPCLTVSHGELSLSPCEGVMSHLAGLPTATTKPTIINRFVIPPSRRPGRMKSL